MSKGRSGSYSSNIVALPKAAVKARSDADRAVYAPYKLLKSESKADTFTPAIRFVPTPTWQYSLELEWDQISSLLDFLEIERDATRPDLDAVNEMLIFFRKWQHGNLKGQMSGFLASSRSSFEPKIIMRFEHEADIVKWKLSWHGV